MNAIKKIEAEIAEAEKAFHASREALEIVWPDQLDKVIRAISKAEDQLLTLTAAMCSQTGGNEDSSVKVLTEEITRKRLLLETFPKAKEILKQQLEDARNRTSQKYQLISRARYLKLREELIAAGQVVDKDVRVKLVGFASGDSIYANEAHRLCDALDKHSDYNRRMKKAELFEFEVRKPDILDQEIAAL